MGQRTSARNGIVWAAALSALAWVPVAIGQVAPSTANPPTTAPAVASALPDATPAPAVPAPVAAAPVAAGPVAAAPVAPTPPAILDIQINLAQKQYSAAIRGASKLLSLRGDAASGFSRFQVLMLKGDAQVGARALSAARVSYHDAIRETRDPHEKALATWTVELFRQAKGTTYVPHVAGPGAANSVPIDLIDPDNRKGAFAALLDDQLSAMGPQLKQASGSPSLPQILPVVKQLQALAELDEIANGTETRTATAAGTLLDHARNLMSNALKGMWTRTGDIYSSATQIVTTGGGTVLVNGQPVTQTITSQNGLTTADGNELRSMIDTCAKIHDAATVFSPLAHGTDDKEWGAILNDSNRVAGRARDVLAANYSTPTASTQYPTDGNGFNNGFGGGGINGNVYYPPGGVGGYNGVYPGAVGTTPYPPKQPTNPTAPSGTGTVATPPTGTAGGAGSGTISKPPPPTPRGGGAGVPAPHPPRNGAPSQQN